MWWDEERIIWYKRAAEKTEFHCLLASEIEKYLNPDDTVLELGCGLGYISEILAQDGFAITATDSDAKAINEAVKRSGLSIFHTLDAKSTLPPSDVLLMIFFGRIEEENSLDHYLNSTGKLIYIISEHRGQSDGLRHKSGEPEKTTGYLSKRNDIMFRRIPFTADFSQPLRDMTDADRYLERMYGSNAGKYRQFLQKTENGYTLPNRKHVSIFIIEKGGKNEESTDSHTYHSDDC